MKEVQEVKSVEKLAVAFKSPDDIFVFFENDGEVPQIVGRAGSLKDLLRVIGDATGHGIRVEEYFGDYIYKVLSGEKSKWVQQ